MKLRHNIYSNLFHHTLHLVLSAPLPSAVILMFLHICRNYETALMNCVIVFIIFVCGIVMLICVCSIARTGY